MARNTYGLIGGNNGRSAYRLLADNQLKTELGGLPLDVMPGAEPTDPVKAAMNAVASRVASNQPGNISRGSSSSESSSIAGPASTEDIMRLLSIAGIQNDGSKVDINQFKSKAIPEYEGLQQMIANRPTEVSLRGLDQIANALSSTDRKVKFDQAGYTADDKLKQYTDIGAAIQKQRDDEMKRQEDLFKAISGVTSVRSSGKTATSEQGSAGIPQPPRPAGMGGPKKRNPTAGEIQQLSEARSALDSVDNVLKVIEDNKDLIGPVVGRKYTIGRGEDSGMITQGLAALIDKNDPKAARAATVRAAIDLVRQTLGKPTEGGVLRKEDEAKYKTIIGDMTRNPDAMLADLQNFRKDLANRGAQRIDLMNSSNINMGPEYKSYTDKFLEHANSSTKMPGGETDTQAKARALLEARKKAKK